MAIIDENDIWAVGEIYTENDKYNAAHWDGEKWELRKIFINGYFYPIKTIIAFANNDLWVSNITLIHFNGNEIDFYTTPPLDENGDAIKINKIWGTSSKNLYVVGNKGLIAHYNEQEWTRIPSGFKENINDLFGYLSQNSTHLYGVAGNLFESGEKHVFYITKKYELKNLDWPFPNNLPYSFWAKNRFKLFIAGDGLYQKKLPKNWEKITKVPSVFKEKIRGIDVNDYFIAMDFLLLVHFNGSSYKTYFNRRQGIYYGLDYKNALIVAVGEKGGRMAYITMGRN